MLIAIERSIQNEVCDVPVYELGPLFNWQANNTKTFKSSAENEMSKKRKSKKSRLISCFEIQFKQFLKRTMYRVFVQHDDH